MVKIRKVSYDNSKTLLKRVGEAADIAKAVKFLIADAPFITGHVLAVDGGRSLNL